MRFNLILAAALSSSSLALILMLVLGLPTSAQSEPRSAAGVTVVVDKGAVERFTHALSGPHTEAA